MKISIIANQDSEARLLMPITTDGVTPPYRLLDGEKYHAEAQTHFTAKTKDTDQPLILIGLGASSAHKAEKSVRYFFQYQASKYGSKFHLLIEHLPTEIQQSVLIGLHLSNYDVQKYKSDKKPSESISISIDPIDDRILHAAQHIASSMMMTMSLVDEPANFLTPAALAARVQNLTEANQTVCRIWDEDLLHKEGFHAILAVGRGSKNAPRLIHAQYRPADIPSDAPRYCLIGKGITYDSGGLSIKQTASMQHMKCDMAGAATVVGFFDLANRLKLPIQLDILIPAAENLIDAQGYKPGDIISSYAGKTIEITDTDAEGRVVLADALAYAVKNLQPHCIIDLATLTGSAINTLGNQAAALFANEQDLASELLKAGEETSERLWQLPLWDAYADDLHSDMADLRNYSGKPTAGAITAAKFLEAFIDKHPSWAHIDFAGMVYGDGPFAKTKTATAYGIRLLHRFFQNRIQATPPKN